MGAGAGRGGRRGGGTAGQGGRAGPGRAGPGGGRGGREGRDVQVSWERREYVRKVANVSD